MARTAEEKRAYQRAWRARNHERHRANQYAWRRANPERVAGFSRKWRLKREYDLTVEAYDAMVAAQGGGCAICARIESRLVVDHDHATGAVRALLCSNCNVALGLLGDDPARAMRAANYLTRHHMNGAT